MNPIILAILVMIFLMSTVIVLSMHVLKEGHVMVVERIGAYYKLIDRPGIYFLFPMIERAIEIVNVQIQTRELTFSTLETQMDEEIIVSYTFQVTDPKSFVYASINSLKTFETSFKSTWLKYKQLDSDQLDEISEFASSLGIHLIEVSIQ
jgi:regulator of protease activity HflC (stomatin/prohibitin superfamily)